MPVAPAKSWTKMPSDVSAARIRVMCARPGAPDMNLTLGPGRSRDQILPASAASSRSTTKRRQALVFVAARRRGIRAGFARSPTSSANVTRCVAASGSADADFEPVAAREFDEQRRELSPMIDSSNLHRIERMRRRHGRAIENRMVRAPARFAATVRHRRGRGIAVFERPPSLPTAGQLAANWFPARLAASRGSRARTSDAPSSTSVQSARRRRRFPAPPAGAASSSNGAVPWPCRRRAASGGRAHFSGNANGAESSWTPVRKFGQDHLRKRGSERRAREKRKPAASTGQSITRCFPD